MAESTCPALSGTPRSSVVLVSVCVELIVRFMMAVVSVLFACRAALPLIHQLKRRARAQIIGGGGGDFR